MHDTIYLVIRWEAWIALLFFTLLLTVGSLFLLGHRKPDWSATRRRFFAALMAPGLILASSAATVVVLGTDERDGWGDLIRAAVFTGAAQLAAVSLVVGLLTAWLVDRLTADSNA